jgi:hypothetical protein
LEYYATTYDIFGAVQSEVSESQISQPTRQGELDRYASLPSLVAVAEVDIRGTRDRADDVLDRWSPRGPTTDGQRKPDLAVPAVGFWVAKPGSTELEALAQGAGEARSALPGAAALLRQAGVRRALELKALLINSTTRTQWSPEWGWGAVDVERAYAQRQGVVSGAVAPGSRAYYRGSVEGAFSTTLAWNRQVQVGDPNNTPWPGCLANLDLRVYRESKGRC